MQSKLLAAWCFAVLCIIFALGLWPFHSPRNDVAWLKQANGLAFGEYGTVLGTGPLASSRGDAGGSLEIWVQPVLKNGSNTILAFYRPGNHVLFTLRQSLADLELVDEFRNDPDPAMKARVYVEDAFDAALRRKKPVVVTVTSGQQGTTVYIDGILSKVAPKFRIPKDAFIGRLILGDAPGQPDSFRGQIRGLAIFDKELNAARVLRDFEGWKRKGRPEVVPGGRDIALYLFDEKAGNAIHNRAAAGAGLYIPRDYVVVDKTFLEPIWKEFHFSRSYWGGNLKNIVGFVPVGFSFYAYFMVALPVRRAAVATVVLGALVSLAIEILQVYLPNRDSGTTDLITNTFGTYVGVLAYRKIYVELVERFPRLGWFAAPRA